jgi:hypothetical protein
MKHLSQEFIREIEKDLVDFEVTRKRMNASAKTFKIIKRIFKIILYPAIGIACLTSLLPILWPITFPIIIAGGVVIVLFLCLDHFVFKDPEGRFRDLYKEKIVKKVLTNIHPSFVYSPYGGISSEKLLEMKMFRDRIDRNVSEDHVTGKISKVDIEFSEHNLSIEKYTLKDFAGDFAESILDMFGGGDDYGDSSSSGTMISFFRGLILHADFNKSFNGSIIVVPRKLVEKGFFKKNHFNGESKLTTDNPMFNQAFSCFCNSDILAHYVLTPALVERILSLKENLKSEIYLSFINGKLNLGIHWDRDIFEADIKKKVQGTEELKELLNEIYFFGELVEELDLNTRIWGEKAMQDFDKSVT